MRYAAGGRRAGARRPSGRTLFDALQQNAEASDVCSDVDLTAGLAGVILTGKTIHGASMFDAATTTLSSKGQVVIPEAIRERLGLKTGAQFVVVADRDVVILKVLEPPALSEFAALTAQARRAAKAAGLKSVDVPRAIKKVRRAK
jgi:AbrB family looped-hinge helix DNA binding protein